MTDSIKITHYKKYNHSFKYKYNIYNNKLLIGYIEFIKKDDILILGYLYIYCKYRDKHYGYKIIEYLLSHYKVTCIIGETLYESRGFWNRCIHKYSGQRKNITYTDNCTSSFVIPKTKISQIEIYNLLHYAYQNIF